jgi:gamma-glutamylcyclotransferase (GGCT)/AIG2-like uncharacterized protein YtfP
MKDDQERIMQQTEMTRVFVYGTLRRGGRNDIHRYQPLPSFITSARVRGRLYHLGRYPGLLLGNGDWVQGEVYEVTPSVLVQLDHLEGLLPQPSGEYHRRTVAVDTPDGPLLCLLYEIDPTRIQGCTWIEHGDWLRACPPQS